LGEGGGSYAEPTFLLRIAGLLLVAVILKY